MAYEKGMLEKAMQYAAGEHYGQTDRAGVPYIAHICAVVAGVKTAEEMVVAALHDIVEDTDITLKYLDEEFPRHIVQAVDALTKRDNEPYSEYLKRVAANRLATAVKIADILHNMDLSRLPEITEKDKQRALKYGEALAFLRASQPMSL